MYIPSLTVILSSLFLIYIGNSLWSIARLFIPPECDRSTTNYCLKSYLATKPALQLMIYTSPKSKSIDYKLIYHDDQFDYETPFEKEINLNLPKSTVQNGTLMMTIALIGSSNGYRPISTDWNDVKNMQNLVITRIPLTKWTLPQPKTFNLLGDENTEIVKPRPFTHIRSRITFGLFAETTDMSFHLPAELVRVMRTTEKQEYLPVIQYNFLHSRFKDLVQLEPQMNVINITISYEPIRIGKFRLIAQMEQAVQQLFQLGFTDKDVDAVKELLAGTNLWILCLTIVIGGIHLLFDVLAFKNDVSFWRNRKSLAGLSPRTVLWRSFSNAVIFVYLIDEKTSLLVLIPSGIATLIEFWKTTKIFKIQLNFGFPCFKFALKANNDAERLTYKHDAEAMKYLSYLLYPLCILGAIYSLVYQPHRSWYSWTVNSLVNGVYAFGFIFMLPQLFVNYRLKSVAALPWRAFMYKAFNTFIDDIFAFIITMPTAHRVACFRDDVIFVIYLYQRWLYPIDYERTDDPDVQKVMGDKDTKKKN